MTFVLALAGWGFTSGFVGGLIAGYLLGLATPWLCDVIFDRFDTEL